LIPYRENEVWDYAVDATKLTEATGWAPQTVLAQGLKETLEKEKNS
jgi:nucleoside-diphosphate-sugar epimerase